MPDQPRHIDLTLDLLESIALAMNDYNEWGTQWYLDLQNSEVLNSMDPELEDDTFDEMQETETGKERLLINIPSRPPSEAWMLMEQYIETLDDDEDRQADLRHAIGGRGAFRRFKDDLAEMGLLDDWYAFKARADAREALDWLYGEELIDKAAIDKGMRLLEDRIARQAQMEEDQANMIPGATVQCRETIGHEDKLTLEKQYEILTERKENLLIRIRDDRGKEVWLPKSHFMLVH